MFAFKLPEITGLLMITFIYHNAKFHLKNASLTQREDSSKCNLNASELKAISETVFTALLQEVKNRWECHI